MLAGLAALPVAVRAETIGRVERLDPALDAVIAPGARVEVLARGFRWAEGPVWLPRGELLFTDVSGNTIHRWIPGRGISVFRRPSGLADPQPSGVREAGANGLALDRSGGLVFADSGNRELARLDLASGRRTVLAARFERKRFNSPNDLAIARSGAIYFTDPPYGLEGGDASPLRELSFNGVYRRAPDGSVVALDRRLARPNGIALSRDERTLYVALSDAERPEVLAYPLSAEGLPSGAPRVFFDMRRARGPGLPDGIKVGAAGRVFATGPGGVHILTAAGKPLGIVSTGKAIANCALGGGWLFLTSSDLLARVRLAAR